MKYCELTFTANRLITRDDKARFAAGGGDQSALREAERSISNNGAMITQASLERALLRTNYTKKTLDALAGGDDTIFVIIDDRDDVWEVESKTERQPDGTPMRMISDNLIMIPPYFYTKEPHNSKFIDTEKLWFKKNIIEVG